MRTIITKDFLKSVKSLEDIQFEVSSIYRFQITKVTINGFNFPVDLPLYWKVQGNLCCYDNLDQQSKIETIKDYLNKCFRLLSDEYCDSSDTEFVSQLRRVCGLIGCDLLHDFRFEDGILPSVNRDGTTTCRICMKTYSGHLPRKFRNYTCSDECEQEYRIKYLP